MTRLPGEHALDEQVLRQTENGWEVVISRCTECRAAHYPPRTLCEVDQQECAVEALSERGMIYEAVRVDVAPEGFTAPYWVAYADFTEGVRLFAPLTWHGDEDPRHGDRVTWQTGIVRTGPDEVMGPVLHGPC